MKKINVNLNEIGTINDSIRGYLEYGYLHNSIVVTDIIGNLYIVSDGKMEPITRDMKEDPREAFMHDISKWRRNDLHSSSKSPVSIFSEVPSGRGVKVDVKGHKKFLEEHPSGLMYEGLSGGTLNVKDEGSAYTKEHTYLTTEDKLVELGDAGYIIVETGDGYHYEDPFGAVGLIHSRKRDAIEEAYTHKNYIPKKSGVYALDTETGTIDLLRKRRERRSKKSRKEHGNV